MGEYSELVSKEILEGIKKLINYKHTAAYGCNQT